MSMKKLLSILSGIGMIAVASTPVVSCSLGRQMDAPGHVENNWLIPRSDIKSDNVNFSKKVTLYLPVDFKSEKDVKLVSYHQNFKTIIDKEASNQFVGPDGNRDSSESDHLVLAPGVTISFTDASISGSSKGSKVTFTVHVNGNINPNSIEPGTDGATYKYDGWVFGFEGHVAKDAGKVWDSVDQDGKRAFTWTIGVPIRTMA